MYVNYVDIPTNMPELASKEGQQTEANKFHAKRNQKTNKKQKFV